MVAVLWLASLIAGAICFGAGLLGFLSNPKSKAALLFLFAMSGVFIALITGSMYTLVDPAMEDLTTTIGMTFIFSSLLAETFLWQLAILFPVERRIKFIPPNGFGLLMVAGVVAAVVLVTLADIGIAAEGAATISSYGVDLLVLYPAVMILMAMVLIVAARAHSSDVQRRSGFIYLVGLWVFALGSVPYMFEATGSAPWMAGGVSLAELSVVVAIAASGLIFSIAIARGQMVMMTPTVEAAVSSTKASYEMLHRRTYLVEEEKPELSFDIFVDILKGRCFDCEDDESFPCESIDCSQCVLPCPCRECTKYASRAQGLIVTRQHPDDVRSQFFIQTTPIVWLSTVAGRDNLDPAKLSLLTDMLSNFMERSQNGVILVDGIEYLMTSNEFSRVLKTVDRWSEIAMTSSSRLIISLDPRAFEPRELALLESNKEIVRT
ncbi:MAG: DUF835 domain-containing protein [Candidatus Thermoplasmatota archaeon]|nr:DUF835 domain-containing protein [Candidatus Thermoplasmatota archaeon]